jgi:ubiquinone/menaquinone biosynthesis C-methylase UbiE
MRSEKLMAGSNIYSDKSDWYELFSQAEDYPKKILEFFTPLFKDKTVLDFGCGTGKFISNLSQVSKKYIATDVAESQLKIAKEKNVGLGNVEIIKTEEDLLPLEDNSVDVIFSSWVLGSVKDLELRTKILAELKRVLKIGGTIYLVENDKGGEYKKSLME